MAKMEGMKVVVNALVGALPRSKLFFTFSFHFFSSDLIILKVTFIL